MILKYNITSKLLVCLNIIKPNLKTSSKDMKFSGLQIAITGKISLMSREEIKIY